MVRAFGRLPFIGRRSGRAEGSPNDGPTPVRRPIDPELAPLGPPVLLPRVIFRQVLFDATELVPAWAMPRSEPTPSVATPEPKAKRTRRPKATASSASSASAASTSPAKGKATTPRRTRKTSAS